MNSFIARRANWDPVLADAPARIDDLFRPVRTADVRHPSAKALLADDEKLYLGFGENTDQDPTPVAFPDGHTAIHQLSAAAPPAPNRLRPGSRPARLNDTPLGVHGRDD